MKRQSSSRPRSARTRKNAPADLSLLLKDVEKEPVPEKLTELAEELQQALEKRRGKRKEMKERRRG